MKSNPVFTKEFYEFDSLSTEKCTNKKAQKNNETKNKSNSEDEIIDIEEIEDISLLLNELNKSAYINLESSLIRNPKYKTESEEIISILRKPLKSKKYLNDNIFKPMKKPKKISLAGKILVDCP